MFRNPVCRKEMRLSVRSKKTMIGLFAFNAILALIAIVAYYGMFGVQGGKYYTTVDFSQVVRLYAVIALMEMGMIAFVIPSVTANTIAGEREKQTLEILLTTRLTPWQIVFGKLIASISTVLLYIISSMPILCIVFSIGGVTVLDMLQVLLYIFVLAIYIGSFGILCSSIFKKSSIATVYTNGMLIAVSLFTYAIIAVTYVVKELTDKGEHIGHIVAINLLNPLVSAIALILHQIGSEDLFQDIAMTSMSDTGWELIGPGMWFMLSVGVQLVVALLCLYLATKRLNPIKKVKASKQEKKEKKEKMA